MHELSIARDLIDLVVEEAVRADASCVVRVKLRIGALAGVVQPALRSAFDAAKSGTIASAANLEVEVVAPTVHCTPCARERKLDGIHSRCCPVCGTAATSLSSGNELELAEIEVS